MAGYATGHFNEEIFDRVLDYAREARTGRKPAAVFMALIKKELGYRPRKMKEFCGNCGWCGEMVKRKH